MFKAFNQWRRFRAAEAELNKLTNRELNDIGLTRGDIPNVVRGSAFHPHGR